MTWDWFAAFTGVFGAALLAVNHRWSKYGYAAFAMSNVSWFIFGSESGLGSVEFQSVGHSITTAIGIWCWLATPEWRSLIASRGSRVLQGLKAAAPLALQRAVAWRGRRADRRSPP